MGAGILAAVARGADTTGRWAAIGLGVSIPISVALDNVLLVVVLACWIGSGACLRIPRLLRDNPVAVAAVVLYGLLVAGSFYGNSTPGDAGRTLVKYLDLLFIPIFLSILRNPVDRTRAQYALAGSLALTLVLSFCIKTGFLPEHSLLTGSTASPSVFKLRLTHNILMAFGAFYFAALAMHAASVRGRRTWACLALLAVINVTLMVEGATGYLVLGALALLLGYQALTWRGVGLAMAGLAAVVVVLLVVPGPFQQRIANIGIEAMQWQPGARSDTSTGQRLEFYRNTLRLVAENPLAGTGTGGFPKAYAERVRGTASLATQNPHNEFLLIAAQLGVVGLAALVYLFWRQWLLALRLAPLERQLARGLVLTMVVGCMLNSLLLDHTEGLLYAWLTGLLYAGLKSPAGPSASAA